MYEKVDSCPICSGQAFTNQLICTDHTVSSESFAIVECDQCSLWITSPRPTSDEIGRFYESDAYISHSNKGNNPINIIYKLVRNYTMKKKTQLIKSYVSQGTVLDYGCGTGDFIASCQANGFTVVGVEPNEQARTQANLQTGNRVYQDLESIDNKEKVDAITLWHVLEHVPDPLVTLKSLKKKLNKGGHMIIAVPNRDSYDASHYKEHWAAYDVPRHLFHFNPLNIKDLSKKTKLKQIDTIPQYFDAFYVSMLSEKYLGHSFSFIRGILNGLTSNRWANNNHNNYSSLIYVLRKT